MILFLRRKGIKKNFNIALYSIAIPSFFHGNDSMFLYYEQDTVWTDDTRNASI